MNQKQALHLLSLIGLPILVYFGGKGIIENAFTETETFNCNSSQQDGSSLNVSITESKRGLYIDGGHAFGIGSIKRSYELIFEHDSKRIKWRGVGIPLILQARSSSFYLATFDRETNYRVPEFQCFIWDGSWHPIDQTEFPKELAVQNLLRITEPEEAGKLYLPKEGDVSLSLDNKFRSSLLAQFWFCISFDVPYSRVTEEIIKDDFVNQFSESIQRGKRSRPPQ